MNEDEIIEAIGKLFLKKRQVLTMQAFKFVDNMQEASDIVSESFIALIEHRKDVNPDKLSEYLYQIMRNKCLSYRRSNTIHKDIYNHLADKEGKMMEVYTRAIEGATMSEVQTREIVSIYRDKIAALTPEQQKIFKLSRYEGKTRAEIAATLGISENSVKYEMGKILESLHSALKDYGDILSLLLLILTGISER